MSPSDTEPSPWLRLLTAAVVVGLVLAGVAHALDWNVSVNVRSGSGHLSTTQRPVAGMTRLALELPAELELVQDGTEALSVQTDDNLQDQVQAVQQGGQLTLRWNPGYKVQILHPSELKLVLHVRSLEHIAITGSGDVHARQLKLPQLDVSVQGSGDLRLDSLEVDQLVASISGSGDMQAAGHARQVQLQISGSGNADLGHLASQLVNLSVAGSGDATVWASTALTASVAGSGDLRYYGGGSVKTAVAGSGSVTRLGVAP